MRSVIRNLHLRYILIVAIAAAVAGAMDVSGAARALAQTAQRTTFINLTIPAPWNIKYPTWVLKATAKSAIVAQGSSTGIGDIQVIEIEGDSYHFVGKNGRGITGEAGSILHTAAQSPDGRLWIVAEHSRFPNGIQGNQFCLYVFEDDHWNLVGPRFGDPAPREDLWTHDDHELHFFEDNRPLTVSIHPNIDGDNWTWRLRLRRLEGDRWVTVPGHDYVMDRDSYLKFLWRSNDAWLLDLREKEGRTTLDARWVKGPRREDVVGPFHLDSWPGKMPFFHFAVSGDDSIAVVACKGDIVDIKPETLFFVKLYHPADERSYKHEEVPFPPGSGHAVDVVAWSPTGELHVVRSTDEKIFVHEFQDGRWTLVGEGTEPGDFLSTIESPHLFFQDDGSPIVTWEKFTQVD